MEYTKRNLDQKLQFLGQKIQAKKDKLIIPGQRDEEAFAVHTAGRIIQQAKNSFFSGKYYDPVEIMFSQLEEEIGKEEVFSGLGYSDVADAPARSAEDITIITSIVSLLPYLGIERSLSNPEDSISYEDLVAMNAHGNINEGDVVVGSFAPSNLDIDLSYQSNELTAAAGTNATLNFGAPIVKGGVRVTYFYDSQDDTKKLVGRDSTDSASIQWKVEGPDAGQAISTITNIPAVQLNYDTGVVTLLGTISADSVKVSATVDSAADNEGSQILRVKPKFPTTILKAEPKNIILESSLSSEAYRNKMLLNSIEAGMSINVAETAFRQLMQTYIAYVNILLTQAVISAGELAKLDQPGGDYIEVDISSYALSSSFADTKNDMMDDFILRLNTQLMGVCGAGGSAILVGTIGAVKLGNVKNSFVKAPAFMQDIDGYIGTYMGIPVVRHRLVDRVSASKYANVYMLYKSPDGKAGPVAFGEYTAPVTTDNALNFKNPEQYAKSLFSFVGAKIVLPRLVAAGRIKYAA